MYLMLAFTTGWDSATFWDKGTEVPLFSGTKGQWDKLEILPRDGPGQPKSGTEQDVTSRGNTTFNPLTPHQK